MNGVAEYRRKWTNFDKSELAEVFPLADDTDVTNAVAIKLIKKMQNDPRIHPGMLACDIIIHYLGLKVGSTIVRDRMQHLLLNMGLDCRFDFSSDFQEPPTSNEVSAWVCP